MAGTPHLIFRERGILYGVRAAAVKEILWLPELTPVETMPVCVAGVFSLRGKIVPVIDLGILFGHKGRRHSLTDNVIVIDSGDRLTGIIADEVVDMLELSDEAVQALPEFGREVRPQSALIEGEARAGDGLAMVLGINSLLDAVSAEGTEALSARPEADVFCPEATEKERKAFHSRTVHIDKTAEDAGGEKRQAVAVIALNGENLGIDLDIVREFSDITGLVPVPCCPSGILGSMNLRGNVLTIIDIREPLGMRSDTKTALKKAVVAQVAGLIIGVAVDDLFEVIYVASAEIRPSDFVVEYGERYIMGTIPYDGSTIAYLDLKKMLSRSELIVDEEV